MKWPIAWREPVGLPVHGGGGEREDAARVGAAGDAVLGLAPPEGRDTQDRLDIDPIHLGLGGVNGLGQLEMLGGLLELPVEHVQPAYQEPVLSHSRRFAIRPGIAKASEVGLVSRNSPLSPTLVRSTHLGQRGGVSHGRLEVDGG